MTEERLPPPAPDCNEVLVIWRGRNGEIGFSSNPFAPYGENAESIDPGLWGALLGAAGRHIATALEQGLEETNLGEIIGTIREAFAATIVDDRIVALAEAKTHPDANDGSETP